MTLPSPNPQSRGQGNERASWPVSAAAGERPRFSGGLLQCPPRAAGEVTRATSCSVRNSNHRLVTKLRLKPPSEAQTVGQKSSLLEQRLDRKLNLTGRSRIAGRKSGVGNHAEGG